ncbi:MAG: TolC family protein, partial [Bacillota bacterium]
KVSVDITGNYDTLSESGSATLNFEYNLFDGGKNELNIESQKESIKNNKEEYEEKYNELELELQKNLNNLSLNKDKLKREKLNYEKSLNDLEVAEKQYNNGVIDYLSYQESWIASNEAEIALKSLRDNNFINKLNFINFINSEKVIGGF